VLICVGDRCEVCVGLFSLKCSAKVIREVIQVGPNHGYTHTDSFLNSRVEAIRLRSRQYLPISIRDLLIIWLLVLAIAIVMIRFRTTNLFHPQNEVAILDIGVLRPKGTGAITDAVRREMPSICVNPIAIEVLFETQFELVFSCFYV